MTELKKLTEAELEQLMAQAMRAYRAAVAELSGRAVRALKAAYGEELRLVPDLYAGTEMQSFPHFQIVWCWYCGKRPGWQREHQTPLSRGGADKPSNVVRSCHGCNSRKGSMTLEEYRESLQLTGARCLFFGERK